MRCATNVAVVVAVSGFQASFVAWVCFVVGIALLGFGVYLGYVTWKRHARDKAKEAKKMVDEANEHLSNAQQRLQRAAPTVRSMTATGAAPQDLEEAATSAEQATSSVQSAKNATQDASTALEQVQSILSALPENLRFAGLLILIGTVLMGVATVQFGGVSLF
jgi:predicted negative regulator of RcsB-dependent stress response